MSQLHLVRPLSRGRHADDASRTIPSTHTRPAFTGWAVLESLADAVLTTDRQDRVTYMNLAAETLLARAAADAIGQPLAAIVGTWLGTASGGSCGLVWRNGASLLVEVIRTPLKNDLGQPSGSVVTCRDAANARALTRELTHRAAHDALTGLPNRHVLRARLLQAMAQAAGDTTRVAVCFVDVDGLKAVNDSLGHLAGDWVLTMVAERLTHVVRSSDTVARIGGDEFVVVFPNVERRADAEALVATIADAVARPVNVHDHWIDVSASVGLALYPDHGRDIETLMTIADANMYAAKRALHLERRRAPVT